MEDIKFNEILAWQKIMSQQQKAAEKSHKMLKSMKQLKNQLVWQHETYHFKKKQFKICCRFISIWVYAVWRSELSRLGCVFSRAIYSEIGGNTIKKVPAAKNYYVFVYISLHHASANSLT